VGKVYRLYPTPYHRALDMLRLLPRNNSFPKHHALADINLEIRRGEKVAIIGRNGAGKSTLLKLISNVSEPTSGRLEVIGDARALLQVGSGFHPDFTGRENVYAYLAYLGITGKDADTRFNEIVDFSELEEYIDQPLKTYSTGMAVRLMFSTSTAVAPDILVLDEVLSVGDAYFSQKSFERIKELSERNGTTLLLVSHEVYSAAKLCPRMIWLDRGRVLIDGSSSSVITAYEDSIRDQEEQRLRKRKQSRLDELARTASDNRSHVIVEIRGRNNQPQQSSVYFSRIELHSSGRLLASLPLAGDSNGVGSHIQTEGSNWGEPCVWNGRPARPMRNFGTAFHKIAGVFSMKDTDISETPLELIVEYRTESPCDLLIHGFHNEDQFDLGSLPPVTGRWIEHRVNWSLLKANAVSPSELFMQNVSLNGRQGSGTIGIMDVTLVNHEDRESQIITHGTAVSFKVRYTVRDAAFRDKAQVLMVFHRDGVLDVCRFITRDLSFNGDTDGVIRLRVPRFPLGNGRYSLTVMIVKEGYFDQNQFLFYSINPDVYACAGRVLEFTVIEGGLAASGTAVVAEGEWSIEQVNSRAHLP
jgi:lipopolysaccharide transport system ATP-binding protein